MALQTASEATARTRARVQPDGTEPSPLGLEDIAALHGTEAMRQALLQRASGYGQVRSVAPLTVSRGDNGHSHQFLVDFERASDAMRASRDWHCFLYSFSSVLVTLHEPGSAGSTASGGDGHLIISST